MDTEFLMQEYNQMFEEKRHYDNRSNLFITMYFAFLTICLSVVTFAYEPMAGDVRYLILLASATQAVTGITVSICLYFNRISAVKVYKQIDAIRNFCLKNCAAEFSEHNELRYEPKKEKYLKIDSMHFVIAALIFCLDSACFVSIGFCLFNNLVYITVLGIVSLLSHFSIYICLLHLRDKKDYSDLKERK